MVSTGYYSGIWKHEDLTEIGGRMGRGVDSPIIVCNIEFV